MMGDESGETMSYLGTKSKSEYGYMGKGRDLGQDDSNGRTTR